MRGTDERAAPALHTEHNVQFGKRLRILLRYRVADGERGQAERAGVRALAAADAGGGIGEDGVA